MLGLKARNWQPLWGDADVFRQKGARRDPNREGANAEQATGAEDGLAWFGPVDSGAGAKLTHLVGNVAEYVCDDVEGMEKVAPGAAAAAAFVASRAGKLQVVGGSAMSPGEVRVDRAQPLDLHEARRGYSDVGLRLAFSAPSQTPSERLAELSRKRWYLPVPGK
jgi:hypothetical protein